MIGAIADSCQYAFHSSLKLERIGFDTLSSCQISQKIAMVRHDRLHTNRAFKPTFTWKLHRTNNFSAVVWLAGTFSRNGKYRKHLCTNLRYAWMICDCGWFYLMCVSCKTFITFWVSIGHAEHPSSYSRTSSLLSMLAAPPSPVCWPVVERRRLTGWDVLHRHIRLGRTTYLVKLLGSRIRLPITPFINCADRGQWQSSNTWAWLVWYSLALVAGGHSLSSAPSMQDDGKPYLNCGTTQGLTLGIPCRYQVSNAAFALTKGNAYASSLWQSSKDFRISRSRWYSPHTRSPHIWNLHFPLTRRPHNHRRQLYFRIAFYGKMRTYIIIGDGCG